MSGLLSIFRLVQCRILEVVQCQLSMQLHPMENKVLVFLWYATAFTQPVWGPSVLKNWNPFMDSCFRHTDTNRSPLPAKIVVVSSSSFCVSATEYTGNLEQYLSVPSSSHVHRSTIVLSDSVMMEIRSSNDDNIRPDLVPAIICRLLPVASVFHVSDVTPVFEMVFVVGISLILMPYTAFAKLANARARTMIPSPHIHSVTVGTPMADVDTTFQAF